MCLCVCFLCVFVCGCGYDSMTFGVSVTLFTRCATKQNQLYSAFYSLFIVRKSRTYKFSSAPQAECSFQAFFFVVPLCGFEIFYSIFLIDLHSNFCWIILTFFFHLLNCLNVCLSRLIYPLQLKQWWWSISQYNQSCSNFYTSRYMLAKPYNAHSNCLCNINSILFDLYTRIL